MAGYGQIWYGDINIVDEDLPEPITPPGGIVPDLMAYLPLYYSKTGVMAKIQQVLAEEIGLIKYSLSDAFAQFFVDTATWGLALWEEFLGIKTDKSKPIEHRRSVIKAKIRGSGTTTKEMIKRVAMAYSGGEVDIIEYPEEYRFVVKFIGVRGIPPNMPDLTNTIEQIKPAHLAFSYIYTFMIWGETKGYTWGSVKDKTWYDLKNYR